MKIAVCLSGFTKYYQHSLDTINRYFAVDGNQVDVFFHTWRLNDKVKQFNKLESVDYVFSPHSYKDYRDFSKDEIVRYFQPKCFIVENMWDRVDTFFYLREKLLKKCQATSDGHARNISLISMYYSLKRSEELRREYELKNNFKYDVVVRMRFDSNIYAYDGNWNPEYLITKPNTLTIPTGFDYPSPHSQYTLNNNFWFADSDTSYLASRVYDNMEELITEIKYYGSESLFGYFVNKHKIESNRVNLVVGINNAVG